MQNLNEQYESIEQYQGNNEESLTEQTTMYISDSFVRKQIPSQHETAKMK